MKGFGFRVHVLGLRAGGSKFGVCGVQGSGFSVRPSAPSIWG